MIKIDENNFIKIEKQEDCIKLILNLKIGFKKNYVIELKLDSDKTNDLITKLVSENSKLKQ